MHKKSPDSESEIKNRQAEENETWEDGYGFPIEDWDEDEILEPHTPRKMGFLDYVIVVLLVLAFGAFGLSSFPYGISNQYQFLDESQQLQNDQLVDNALPAIVYVSIEGPSGTHQGTGFNISPRGRIVTNRHVVEDGSLIRIMFNGGQSYLATSYTAVPGADIAYIDLNSQDLPYINVEQNKLPAAGQSVTIIGNPLGFRFMAQRGTVDSYYRVKDIDYAVFSLDIAANPGNSGSPVLDDQGRAIGIVFAITSVTVDGESERRTLAIPLAGIDL